jgi:hypothetical protein
LSSGFECWQFELVEFCKFAPIFMKERSVLTDTEITEDERLRRLQIEGRIINIDLTPRQQDVFDALLEQEAGVRSSDLAMSLFLETNKPLSVVANLISRLRNKIRETGVGISAVTSGKREDAVYVLELRGNQEDKINKLPKRERALSSRRDGNRSGKGSGDEFGRGLMPLSKEEYDVESDQLGVEIARVTLPWFVKEEPGFDNLPKDPEDFVGITGFGRERFYRLRISNAELSVGGLVVMSFTKALDRLWNEGRVNIGSDKEQELLAQCGELKGRVDFSYLIGKVSNHLEGEVEELTSA